MKKLIIAIALFCLPAMSAGQTFGLDKPQPKTFGLPQTEEKRQETQKSSPAKPKYAKSEAVERPVTAVPAKSDPIAAKPKKAVKTQIRRPTPAEPYYRPRWTWPGGTESSLRRHLAGPPHNIDPDWIRRQSFNTLKRIHDSTHDKIGPVRSTVKPIVINPIANNGISAPQNFCPTGSS